MAVIAPCDSRVFVVFVAPRTQPSTAKRPSHISFSAFILAWPSLPTMMVVHRNAQWPRDLDDRLGHVDVGARSAPYPLIALILPAPEKSLELRVTGAFQNWLSAKVQGARSGRRR